jgi:hypothetical protein
MAFGKIGLKRQRRASGGFRIVFFGLILVVGYNRSSEVGIYYRFLGVFIENGKFTPSFMTLGVRIKFLMR